MIVIEKRGLHLPMDEHMKSNMRTYEKQYGGRFVRHLAYHQVEESWYRELSQNAILRVRMSLCLAYALVKNQALGLD